MISRTLLHMALTARKPDFGAWLKTKIEAKGIKLTQIEASSGIAYPNLNATVNSGKSGKPTQPKEETMKKIIPALLKLGVIEDESEAWIAAGYEVEGYTVVRESGVDYETDPEIQIIVEEAKGSPEGRKALSSMAAALRASRAGAIGKRAE